MTGMVRIAAIVAVALLTAASASAEQPATTAAPAAVPQASATAPAAGTPEVASVKATNGRVLLNRAAAYDPAIKDQRLLPGDRLVVLEGGAVTVRFDGGCEKTVDTASVYTVPALPPCGVAESDRGMRAPVGTATGAGSSEYLKWGVVALGVATPLILLSSSGAGRPISP
jgi:hypothetical protein